MADCQVYTLSTEVRFLLRRRGARALTPVPRAGTVALVLNLRVSVNGRLSDFQSDDGGSIPLPAPLPALVSRLLDVAQLG